jgi:hypothetical protein
MMWRFLIDVYVNVNYHRSAREWSERQSHTGFMSHVLAAPIQSDFTLRKSRFIGCVEPCIGREAALTRRAQLRAEHPGATHTSAGR